MQIKQRDAFSHSLDWQKLRSLTTPSVNGDRTKLEVFYIMITVNYYSTVENNLALSNKTEAVHTLGLNNSSSKYAHVQLEKYTRIL